MSNSIGINAQDGCRFVYGWVQRDALTSDDKSDDKSDDESDDESDDGECGDLASKYNELASKYNELASKYNALAASPFIIISSENDNPSKRSKLFI